MLERQMRHNYDFCSVVLLCWLSIKVSLIYDKFNFDETFFFSFFKIIINLKKDQLSGGEKMFTAFCSEEHSELNEVLIKHHFVCIKKNLNTIESRNLEFFVLSFCTWKMFDFEKWQRDNWAYYNKSISVSSTEVNSTSSKIGCAQCTFMLCLYF